MNRNLVVAGAAALALVIILALRSGRPPGDPTPPPGPVTESVFDPTPARAAAAAAPGQPAGEMDDTRARVEAARESFRDGASGPPGEAAPEPERFDMSRMGDREFVHRMERHLGMQQYLTSPARDTPEFREIAELCRRFNYEPWAVPAIYNLAYELEREARAMEAIAAGGMPDQEAQAFSGMFLQARSAEVARRLGVEFEPAFLDAVRQVRPTVFVGQRPLLRNGEALMDTMGWDAIDQLQPQP